MALIVRPHPRFNTGVRFQDDNVSKLYTYCPFPIIALADINTGAVSLILGDVQSVVNVANHSVTRLFSMIIESILQANHQALVTTNELVLSIVVQKNV